ncbi:MAG: DUF4383 domain-containing protein [Actinobacteria bacterium]|nr:DUF4383 domain-containing protein [Actinomycetota bacterium]
MATRDITAGTGEKYRTLAQKLALFWGVAFVLAGVLGFIPGITSNYDDLKFAGHDSDAELLGLFQVSILHNIVHLLFGVGILMARTWESAKNYLLGSGVIYVVLVLYGILFGGDNGDANFVPVNDLDTYLLHPVLAIGLLLSYFMSRRDRDTAYDRGAMGTSSV